jgi:hypothetical protein
MGQKRVGTGKKVIPLSGYKPSGKYAHSEEWIVRFPKFSKIQDHETHESEQTFATSPMNDWQSNSRFGPVAA